MDGIAKKLLLVLGVVTLLLAIIVGVMFATGQIELVSVEQAYQREQGVKKQIAELEAKMDKAIEQTLKHNYSGDLKPTVSGQHVRLDDLQKIQNLVDEGQYKEALEAHLWFHEASKRSVEMTGVRLSFALSSWAELGELYPPAKQALTEVRNDNVDLLLSGEGSFSHFLDLSSINRVLEEDARTIDLFEILDSHYPSKSSGFYHVIEDLLIKEKRYDILREFFGDPVIKLEKLRFQRETSLSVSHSSVNEQVSKAFEFADRQFVQQVLALIEVCKAIGKEDSAREIQKRALSYFDNEQIREAIK